MDDPLEEITGVWWRYFGPTGSMGSGAFLTDQQVEEQAFVERRIWELASDPMSFGRIVCALVNSAPSKEHLRFIGTEVLESVEEEIPDIVGTVELLPLDSSEIALILEGYMPGLDQSE